MLAYLLVSKKPKKYSSMHLYEAVFILRQDIARVEMQKVVANLKSFVLEAEGGKILQEEYWGLRPLAYPVRKNKKGHYVMLIIESNTAGFMSEMKRYISLSVDVVRELFIKIKEYDGKPSLMMTMEKGKTDDV